MYLNYFQEVKISLLKHLVRSRQEWAARVPGQVVQEEMKKNAFIFSVPALAVTQQGKLKKAYPVSFKAFGQVRSRHQVVQEEMKKNAF
jgi:hypothetical protein